MKPPRRMRQFKPQSIEPPQHAHPLVRELYEHMQRERIGPRDIAERAGLGRSVISAWGRRHSPQVTTLEAAGGVLGLRLAWVPVSGE